MIAIRPAIRSDARACARLIVEPSGGINAILGDRRAALRAARAAFLVGDTGLGWNRSLVADEGGIVVGLAARLPGSEWSRLRVRTGLAMLVGARGRAHRLVWRGAVYDRAVPTIPADVLYVMSLAVLPGRRGRGIGAALLARVGEEAAGLGVRAVALDVDAGNGRGIASYRREGFEPVAEVAAPASRGLPPLASIRMERPVA